jgi:hypothetical protein
LSCIETAEKTDSDVELTAPRIEFESPFESIISDGLVTKEDVKTECTLSFNTISDRGINRARFYVTRTGGRLHKPVIYLYPDCDNTPISVQLSFNGKLTDLYPKPDTINGEDSVTWNVVANRDGTITTTDTKLYNYIFWEGKLTRAAMNHLIESEFSVTTATLVPKNLLIEYLEQTLTKRGLSDKESQDFLLYWLPIMNEFQYNYIQFINGTTYSDLAPLSVKPMCSTFIRVFMLFRGTDDPPYTHNLFAPAMLQNPCTITSNRSKFTLVEWGGSCLNNQ